MQDSTNHKIITKILTKTIFSYEFNQFKEENPKSHVGRFPMSNDPIPMKWIMVYPVELDNIKEI